MIVLKLAKPYEAELNELMSEIVFDDRFKYFVASNYYEYNLKLADSSWNQLDFVSLKNKKMGE